MQTLWTVCRLLAAVIVLCLQVSSISTGSRGWVLESSAATVRSPSVVMWGSNIAVAFGYLESPSNTFIHWTLSSDGGETWSAHARAVPGYAISPVLHYANKTLHLFFTSSMGTGGAYVTQLLPPGGDSPTRLNAPNPTSALLSGALFPIIDVPGKPLGWGLPFWQEYGECEAGVLLTNATTPTEPSAVWTRAGCLTGRWGNRLLTPSVVRGYTCASYADTLMLTGSSGGESLNPNQLWLSSSDAADTEWATAVPLPQPSAPHARIFAVTGRSTNKSTTPPILIAQQPPASNLSTIVVTTSSDGAASWHVWTVVEAPNSSATSSLTSSPAFADVALAVDAEPESKRNVVVAVYVALRDASSHVDTLGIRFATFDGPW
jgi:hypothetical protein